jgi:hypothetical protein
VVDAVRRTIGVEHAAPALFQLPAPGRLLVSGPGGAWIVNADGSKRRLGDYREAAWSPHGLYVVAASANELAAVEPGGKVRWSLARPDVAFPRWGGSHTDTRIAYLSLGRLHVVGGDGRGDGVVGRVKRIAPAWQPGDRRLLAFVTTTGRVALLDADTHRRVWTSRAYTKPRALAWMPDGTRLALATAAKLVLIRADTGNAIALDVAGVRALAFSHAQLAVVRGRAVSLFDGGAEPQQLFAAPAAPAGLAWSPNGRWLVTALPGADQWVFVQARNGHRVVAVSNIRAQLGGPVTLDGWAPGT